MLLREELGTDPARKKAVPENKLENVLFAVSVRFQIQAAIQGSDRAKRIYGAVRNSPAQAYKNRSQSGKL